VDETGVTVVVTGVIAQVGRKAVYSIAAAEKGKTTLYINIGLAMMFSFAYMETKLTKEICNSFFIGAFCSSHRERLCGFLDINPSTKLYQIYHF